jgi:hypothetical protein
VAVAYDTLTKERILYLFARLDDKMSAKGVEATIFVVGGAALALTVSGERVTTDVDGQYEDYSIDELAKAVAQEEHLPEHWLNHSINVTMGYFKKDTDPLTVFNGKCLSIQAASPQFILAMKLASRREKDTDDIVMLIHELGLTDKNDIIQIVNKYFMADLSAAAWQRQQIDEFLDLIIEEGRLEFGGAARSSASGEFDKPQHDKPQQSANMP